MPIQLWTPVLIGESIPSEPECESDADCASEQKCVPEKDHNGNPKLGTEHCETPDRERLDVGPIVISGFASGPQTFLFESNDAVYKLNGSGDGSVDPGLITYDVNYTLNAQNPTPSDLDSFTGSYRTPVALELTSHETVQGTMGDAIIIDTTQPVKFEWTGNGGTGFVEINLTAASSISDQISVVCKVVDDGEFEIPQNFTSQMVFGTDSNVAMMNMLTMKRVSKGTIIGSDVSSGFFRSEQIIIFNVTPSD